MGLAHGHIELTGYIFGDDVGAQRGCHIGKLVLYERVGMVRAAGKQDDGAAQFQCLGIDAAVYLHHFVLIVLLCLDGLSKGTAYATLVYSEPQQIAATLAVECLLILKGEHRCIDGHIGGLHALDHLRVARHHGAVVAVLLTLRALIHHEGHEHAVDAPVYQFLHMCMGQLGWEADVVGHDLPCHPLVVPIVGGR